MDDEDALEMIDILSFKSNELNEKLSKNSMNENVRQEEILKYLAMQSQSPHSPPIEDFKPGKITITSFVSHFTKINLFRNLISKYFP